MLGKSRAQAKLFDKDRDAETLTGTIEGITFRADDSYFVIFRFRVDDERLITAKGDLAFAELGEHVTLRGHWHRDPKWGHQFQFHHGEATAPTSREGLLKYLSSGLVNGIGPSYAKRLVEHFGENVLAIVDAEPERLLEVDGIGKKRQQQIVESLNEQKLRRDTLVSLYGFGLSPALSAEVIKKYGDQAVNMVKQNPYLLARELRGVGFLTADKIAAKAGIAHDSPARVRAGILHFLRQSSLQGDTLLPVEELQDAASRGLQVDEALVEKCLLNARLAGEVEQELYDTDAYVGLPEYLHAERVVAMRLNQLARAERRLVPSMQYQKAVEWASERLGVDLTEEQKRAVMLSLAQPVSVITGGPGVGKTTVLKALVEILEAKNCPFSLAAPTGRAAKRLEEATGRPASTLHRLLEFTPGTWRFRKNERDPLNTAFLIVDESSMLDVSLAAAVVRALPAGASLCFVGDKDQLPSIGPGAVLRDLLESGVIPASQLTEVFRQAATSGIVRSAHAIHRGQLPELQNSPQTTGDGDFFFLQRDTPEACLKTIINLVTRRLPKAYGFDPVEDIQVLSPMHRGLTGTTNINAQLQEFFQKAQKNEFLTRGKSQFAAGDKIMQRRNDYDREVFNGSFGRVLSVQKEAKSLVALFDGRSVSYQGKDLDGLNLAYAASIHKSQGSEFPAVVIPILSEHYVMLKRNLLYTGMTRARRLVVLVGQRRAVEMAVANDTMHHRRTTLGVRLSQLFHDLHSSNEAQNGGTE